MLLFNYLYMPEYNWDNLIDVQLPGQSMPAANLHRYCQLALPWGYAELHFRVFFPPPLPSMVLSMSMESHCHIEPEVLHLSEGCYSRRQQRTTDLIPSPHPLLPYTLNCLHCYVLGFYPKLPQGTTRWKGLLVQQQLKPLLSCWLVPHEKCPISEIF